MGGDRDDTLRDLEVLYRARFGDFHHVATAITGDDEAGRDAVQEAFARAVRSAGKFRGDGTLEAWVWPIVLNAARAERRSRRRPEPDPPEGSSTEVAHPDVREAIAELPDRQRHALFLRYYADLDYAAIAEALGVSIGTVGAMLNKAHATLRARLQEVRP